MKKRSLVSLWIGIGCALLFGFASPLGWLENRLDLAHIPLLPIAEAHAATAHHPLAGWYLRIADVWLNDTTLGAIVVIAAIALSRLSIGRGLLGHYVSPHVFELPLQPPERFGAPGARRETTIFFSDVVGFNSISEGLRPDEFVDFTKQYLAAMSDVVFECNGYLDKYIGDGIMAVWNAPDEQPDHAVLACRCALRSIERLDELNRKFVARGWRPLNVRIGLSTGLVVAGHVGSARKKDYTVMGAPVSLAVRLEAANKPFGTTILLSESTHAQVKDHFETRFLDCIQVPGEPQPIKIYELLCERR